MADPPPRLIDPILSLPVPSPVASLCFVSGTETDPSGSADQGEDDGDDSDDSDSDDDDDEIQFRSSALLQGMSVPASTVPASSNTITGQQSLQGRYLVSCHYDGEALLWDLTLQQRVGRITSSSSSSSGNHRGPGMAVRRTANSSRFLYQTRDEAGTVSLHALERVHESGINSCTARDDTSPTTISIVRQYQTYTQSFCQATPCWGNEHLMAMPAGEEAATTVVDHRASNPVAVKISVEGNHGMLTSLGLSVVGEKNGGNRTSNNKSVILACGMESGTAFFYDLAMPRSPILSTDHTTTTTTTTQNDVPHSSYQLGKEPVLTLDLIPSTTTNPTSSAVLVVAGLAGDATEMALLPESEAGRAVLFKATAQHELLTERAAKTTNENHRRNDSQSTFHFRQRARLSTCRVDETSYGKPGVSTCRFRPCDGRLFAAGGWDRRIRLFDRTQGAAMAILKGNEGSVAALDWAPDADISGMLATSGSGTNLISFWQIFAKK